MGHVQNILPPLGARGGAGAGKGAALFACIGGALSTGVPGKRESGISMWGVSSVLLYNLDWREYILGRYMTPTSS